MLILSWIAVAFAAVLVIHAIFRARRRVEDARCPKCAYDMQAAIGLACTECGHVARTAEQLHRPGRRRWVAPLALALLAGAWMLRCGTR